MRCRTLNEKPNAKAGSAQRAGPLFSKESCDRRAAWAIFHVRMPQHFSARFTPSGSDEVTTTEQGYAEARKMSKGKRPAAHRAAHDSSADVSIRHLPVRVRGNAETLCCDFEK